MYTQTFLAKLCQEQQNCGDVDLNAYIMTYDNVSRTMFVNRSLAEYTRVESLMKVLPRSLNAKGMERLDIDPMQQATFRYDRLRDFLIAKCATADALALINSEETSTTPGITQYSAPALTVLPWLPIWVSPPSAVRKETPTETKTEEAYVVEPFRGKVDELTGALEAFTFQLTRLDDPSHHLGGQHNARAFAIQADYTSPGPPIGPSG